MPYVLDCPMHEQHVAPRYGRVNDTSEPIHFNFGTGERLIAPGFTLCDLTFDLRYGREEALGASQDCIETTLDRAREAALIASFDGQIQYANPAFNDATGYSASDIAHFNWPDFVRRDAIATWKAVRNTVGAGNVWHGWIDGSKGGRSCLLQATVYPLVDGGGSVTHLLTVARDRAADAEYMALRQTVDEYHSVVSIVRAIAHDFSNVLAACSGYTEIMQDAVGMHIPEVSNCLSEQFDVVQRGNRLLRTLQTICRESRLELAPLRIDSFIDQSAALLRKSLSNVQFRAAVESKPLHVHGDAPHLLHVLFGACAQVQRFLGDSEGAVSIVLDEAAPPTDATGQRLARIRITGAIVEGDLCRRSIVERSHPYFLDRHEPTRIGWSTIVDVVRRHNGDATSVMRTDREMEIEILLPIVEAGQTRIDERADVETVPRGNERILLVDDEAPMLRTLSKTLLSLGYHVTTRNDGASALEAVFEHPERFDLVLTDLTMPGLTGRELAKRITADFPSIVVLLYTGESDLRQLQNAKDEGVAGILKKPIMKRELAIAVRGALDR